MMIRVGMQVRQQVKLVHRRGKLVKVLMGVVVTQQRQKEENSPGVVEGNGRKYIKNDVWNG